MHTSCKIGADDLQYGLMVNLRILLQQSAAFRDDRNWRQYHSPHNQLRAFYTELSHVIEHFLYWPEQVIIHQLNSDPAKREIVAGELADFLFWVLLVSSDATVSPDLESISSDIKHEGKLPLGIGDRLSLMMEHLGKLVIELRQLPLTEFGTYHLAPQSVLTEHLHALLVHTLALFEYFGLDVEAEFAAKMAKNKVKYPLAPT